MFKYLYNIKQESMLKYDLWMDDTAIINFLMFEFKKDNTYSLEIEGKRYFKVSYKKILDELCRIRFGLEMLKKRFKHYKDIKLIERPDLSLGLNTSYMRFNEEIIKELFEEEKLN